MVKFVKAVVSAVSEARKLRKETMKNQPFMR